LTTTAVFRAFGKLLSEAFTTSKRSASKQLNTLLKKDATQGCADHLSDVIDFLTEERSKLTALAV